MPQLDGAGGGEFLTQETAPEQASVNLRIQAEEPEIKLPTSAGS